MLIVHRVRRLLPTAADFSVGALRHDVLAGVTVALVALPNAMIVGDDQLVGPQRTVAAIAAQAVYTIVLRELIERHGDWCWVAIEIVDRQKRGA